MNDFSSEAKALLSTRLVRGQLQYTDTSNAERMLSMHGQDIRYCAAWKKWLLWDTRRWRTDANGEIFDLAKETIRKMYADAAGKADARDRYELETHAVKSESVRKRRAMVEAAGWERRAWIGPDDLDRNDWLFNCLNGTVDLSTGRRREPEKKDLITMLANVMHDEKSKCPLWKAFLRRIMNGNLELVTFLQKAAGWALSGDMSEQTMFILWGNGANGKSTFLNTILDLLGDYGLPTPTETFMKRSTEQISNDIARLRGTRFVTTIEADQGKSLSEPLIKQVTGNDRMTARFLYGEFFDFSPTFKIFMATNHKPVIKGTDHAIWRRIRLIPFTVTIPAEQQDKYLARKLKGETSGILNWLIEGCLKWQQEGLGYPPAVKEATEKYRDEMDVIGSFIRDRCELGGDRRIQSRELFKAYQVWCGENNERAGSERLLALRLQEMGYEKNRRTDARYWLGLGLRAGK